ncbi:MAG: hypothetical protein HYS13_17560 [Planctomycetia bacterium]|nr:hypothetical protein [Planctomycetia bacterium]
MKTSESAARVANPGSLPPLGAVVTRTIDAAARRKTGVAKMKWDSGTVFILGAGFTKAFLPEAPLLIDDYGGEGLKRKFVAFSDALGLLDTELTQRDHPPGWLNLERLMTRLSGGMPYDYRFRAEESFRLLLSELKRAFLDRLASAQKSGRANDGELWLFAGHCARQKCSCVTFNYDDVLDGALWQFCPVYAPQTSWIWCPDWGYGFGCQASESCVRESPIPPADTGSMLLLKLHGSVNWRIPLGHPRPYTSATVRHHEPWFQYYGTSKIPLEEIEPHLESEPFLVPPVLTKTSLVEEPILRFTWSRALDALRSAKRAVFMGYSLPLTDIAAGFLFREGLGRLDQSTDIAVIDYAQCDDERNAKLGRLKAAYGNVFPAITEGQFCFDGAAQWVRDNLTEWLYDSHGDPVAFSALQHIVSRAGRFIGTVRGYLHPRQDIWHDTYKAEIVDGNRLLRADPPPEGDRGHDEMPPLPAVPTIPPPIAPMVLPPGYRDVDLDGP